MQPFETLVCALGADYHKNQQLVRFAETLCRTGNLTLRLVHVYERSAPTEDLTAYLPLPGVLGSEAEGAMRQAEVSELDAAAERLRFLAASVSPSVRVRQDVAVGEIVPEVRAIVAACKPCLLLVGATSSHNSVLPQISSHAVALMNAVDAPVIALPHDAQVGKLSFLDPRILIADDLREDSTSLLETTIDFLRTLGHGKIVDTHVKSLATDMFAASLAEIYVTALGGRPEHHVHNPQPGLVGRIRPRLKRLLNERASRVFERKGHEGFSFQSMVLRGNIIKALRGAVGRINADMLVFGRHHALHRSGDWLGHVSAKTMLSFQRPILIVPV